MFPHSWATIGRDHFYEFELQFAATFRNPLPDGNCWIGVGVRSQALLRELRPHSLPNRDGSIVLTEPNETPPKFYEDNRLRDATSSSPPADHTFQVFFRVTTLQVRVDDFSKEFPLAQMKKVLGPGVIRLQAYRTWMGLRSLSLRTE
jgi:hypothetical protein